MADAKPTEGKSDAELRTLLEQKQAELKAAQEKMRPNYPRWPEKKPAMGAIIGPVLLYYGLRDADAPFTPVNVAWPLFTFSIALVVGQSLVEYVDRTEWRQNLREEAIKTQNRKAKEKEEEDKKKEKKEKAGSTKKKKN